MSKYGRKAAAYKPIGVTIRFPNAISACSCYVPWSAKGASGATCRLISHSVWSRRKATKSASPVRNSDVNNEQGESRGKSGGDRGRERSRLARFGMYSETHKGEDPFSHSRGGKVGSRGTGAQCEQPRSVVARLGLIRLEHAPKRANAQIAFILAS